MINVKLDCVWLMGGAGGTELDGTVFSLLQAVAETGSLYQAARKLGISYRHAWGLMGKWSQHFGQPLVNLERGRGATLTEVGRRLLSARGRVNAKLGRQLETLASEIEADIHQALAAPGAGIRIFASHDFALEKLRAMAGAALPLDIQFRGSLESLEALARSQCEVAGFHIPEGELGRRLAASYRKWVKPDSIRLIQFVSRMQGLMVTGGNPKRITGINDLTRAQVRFVNRQRGSGTRLVFDQLLKEAGIDQKRIAGFETEEFTHAAVAATVASGMADAGFGIEAAARQFGLDFIPIATERYYLACRDASLDLSSIKALLEMLRSRKFRRAVAKLPGYRGSKAGNIMDIGEHLA